ncbi:NAD-dependent protein deacetylase sirtuin-2 [Physocladia obscura]|uniref:NAD-dependent protein deacetylase sirtuin-2 n=1 Tax=Physocladia obscura TaxID=109957 RepID=A0AAD5SW73_9FUNG|nr:NAD-dependent protein deacetylase sirtuin-2 [Physocladia obscura]
MAYQASFGDQEMFAVYPKLDCEHVAQHVGPLTEAMREWLAGAAAEGKGCCGGCSAARAEATATEGGGEGGAGAETAGVELWACLAAACATVGCSRYAAAHALSHSRATHHHIALSLADLSVFCYACDSYVEHPALHPAIDCVHLARFDEPHPAFANLQDPSSSSSSVPPASTATNNSNNYDTDLSAFANHIRSNNCSRIVVLAGAGLSTSAGIPDFRSPGSGLYYNLQKYNLPSPESVFDIAYFRNNPLPFFTLAKELFPGNFAPTLSHYFLRLLSEKNFLRRIYTQNIDTLERAAKINPSYIVEAHGSFGSASCVGGLASDATEFVTKDNNSGSFFKFEPAVSLDKPCGATYSQNWIQERIFSNNGENIPPKCDNCKHGIVKPDITFFGESLPKRFFDLCERDLKEADAVIVIGSSLKVMPFAILPTLVNSNVPRLLINRELVGDFEEFSAEHLGNDDDAEDNNGKGKEPANILPVSASIPDRNGRRDHIFLGDCDDGCLKFAELLGFKQELLLLVEKETAAFSNTTSTTTVTSKIDDKEKDIEESLNALHI